MEPGVIRILGSEDDEGKEGGGTSGEFILDPIEG